MPITKKNHYNPCFWSAYWNFDYYKAKSNGINLKAREQKVFTLNLNSNKIIVQKTEQIFFEKNAGLADLTKEEVLSYCKRVKLDEYDNMKNYFDNNPEDTVLDFENHFTGFENLYSTELENTILSASIPDISMKTILSFFIITQLLRNHNTLNHTFLEYKNQNKAKFEVFLDLKNTFSDRNQLLNLIAPFFSSKWTLYKIRNYELPLSDSPLLIRPFHIMIALAPDLLLEIDLKTKVKPADICEYQEYIPFDKYKEFYKRTIENSTREIIFGDEETLSTIKNSEIYKNHILKMKNAC